MENKRKFGLKEIVLGTALAAGATAMTLGLGGCNKEYLNSYPKTTYERIEKNQNLSEGSRNYIKGVCRGIDLHNLKDDEKEFLKLGYSEKVSKINKNLLNYYSDLGLINPDKLRNLDFILVYRTGSEMTKFIKDVEESKTKYIKEVEESKRKQNK